MTRLSVQFTIILVTGLQFMLCTAQLDNASGLSDTSTTRTVENNTSQDGASSSLNVTDRIANQSPEQVHKKSSCDPGFECVAYYLCKDNMIIKDGVGIIDMRFDEDCSDIMKTCCAISNLTTPTPLPPVIRPLLTEPSSPLVSPLPTSNGCGIRNVNGVGIRITGAVDNETQFAEFPWMVAILRREQNPLGDENLLYQCGGSLINPSVVMTAAHCVSGLPTNVLKIRAGEWDTKTILEPLPHQDRDIGQIIVHEEYQKASLRNDIALIFLISPLEITENVRPTCLPPADVSFDDRRCFATGWGKHKYGQEGRNPVILKKIDLPIMAQQECQNVLRMTRLGRYFELHDSFICAGGEEGKDTCRGDGGSPLVCTMQGGSNQYYQVGIVSWGIGCGDNNIPGVYTRVMKFRPWIDQIMSDKNLDKFTYLPS